MNNPIKLTEKITFSIEKGHRFFKTEDTFYFFLVVQFYIEQYKLSHRGKYKLLFSKNDQILFSYDILIDKNKKQVHSSNGLNFIDPLIESEHLYNITFHFPWEVFKSIHEINDICVVFMDDKHNILMSKHLSKLKDYFYDLEKDLLKKSWNSHIISQDDKTYVYSKKDCVLTLHLGNHYGYYHEEDFPLKKDDWFNLTPYIGSHSYIGVQSFFEDQLLEIEEKYILVGLNGMYVTGSYQTGDNKIEPIFDYCDKYQQKYGYGRDDVRFEEIFSINELVSYFKYKDQKPVTFSCDYLFILKNYIKNSTYNQNLLFSSKPPPTKAHTNNAVCQNCPLKSECLQTVPSGLSKELMKKNLSIFEHDECEIYKLFNKTDNPKS